MRSGDATKRMREDLRTRLRSIYEKGIASEERGDQKRGRRS